MGTSIDLERQEPVFAAGPRVLVLQIRDNPVAERQERECFVEHAALPGMAPAVFVWRNLIERPDLSLDDARTADAVVIGGAGAHSVTTDDAFTRPLARFVEQWVGEGRPLFGSCFGHQFVAKALGGRVENDPEREEIGTFDLELTPAGVADPLFAGSPRRFPVQLAHHDRVVELPAAAIELAATELAPNQAFRYADRLVWGCQFHVEMDERRFLERAALYRDGYVAGDTALTALRSRLRPSPEAAMILGRFLSLAAAAKTTA